VKRLEVDGTLDADLRYYHDWLWKIEAFQKYKVGFISNPVIDYAIHLGQASIECRKLGMNGTEEQLMRVKLKDKYGSVDDFVAYQLNYEPSELGKYFSAEQVDAIALALDNINSGKGFIIGDQTGIGKGRVNAAMIKYAMLNKITPIFVTEKPNLYSDMIRDLTDIGVTDIMPLATNNGDDGIIPLNKSALAWDSANEQAKENKEQKPPIPNDAKFAKVSDAKKSEILQSNNMEGYDAIFTTYSQMQTRGDGSTPRIDFLNEVANGALLILDESHNAGGTSGRGDEEKVGRAGVVRALVNKAKGVFYSSATYAKRPDVLDLYSKTDMGLIADPKTLKDSLVAGGVPLQQAVASMLAKAGQYIRREKSFDGINYDTVVVDVDRDFAENSSTIMRDIMKFDSLKGAAVKRLDNELKAGGRKMTGTKATGGAGAESANFASVMHNMIGQMLLILKVQPTIDQALESLKRGEKPVITVSNTMGAAIDDFVSETGLNPGDAINLNFGNLLKRYLKKSRMITEKDAMGVKTVREMTDEELGPNAVKFYKMVGKKIDSLEFDKYPVSPIDAIHDALHKAGYKTGEITGRSSVIDYSGELPIYKKRPGSQRTSAGKRKTINDFNNGLIDVVVLNQSGATGISLHASPKVGGDTRKRHMIIAQAELNIDTHMQILGRINRTGQIVLPSYAQLTANIPAEKRPSSILAKKMAMLNANTTAGKESAVKAKDVPDFMNDYGDEIAAAVMNDHREIHALLGNPLVQGTNGFEPEGAMRKVTGRIPVLSLKDQEALYNTIEEAYNEYIDTLNKTGQNELEAQAMNLDAKTVETIPVVAQVGDSESPFSEGVNAEKVSVKRLGKPYTLQQITDLIKKLGVTDRESKSQWQAKALDNIDSVYQQRLNQINAIEPADDMEANRKEQSKITLEQQANDVKSIVRNYPPGTAITLISPMGIEYPGYIGNFERKGDAKNYFAKGNWKVTFYVADAAKQFVLPLSKIGTEDSQWTIEQSNAKDVNEALEEGQSTSREDRIILTGNMLSAYSFDKSGRIINYTTDQGNVKQGVLMPKKFNVEQAIDKKPIIFSSPDLALEYIKTSDNPAYGIRSNNNDIRLLPQYNGLYTLYVPKSKTKGGNVFLNTRLTDLVGNFISSGKDMFVRISQDKIDEATRILYPLSGPMQPISKDNGKKFLTDKGVKFSKADTVKSGNTHTPTPLKTAMQQVMDGEYGDGWTNRLFATGKFTRQTYDEPNKNYPNINRSIQGFYDPKTDTTILIADNIDKSVDLFKLAQHEIGVHALTLGETDAEFQKIMEDMLKLVQTSKPMQTAYTKALESFGIGEVPKLGTPINGVKREDVLHELAGYLVEKYPRLSHVQKLVAWMRKAIRNLGKELPALERMKWVKWANSLNEKDVVYMAISALKKAPESLLMDSVGRSGDTVLMAKYSDNKITFPTRKELIDILKSHPLIKLKDKVNRAFIIGSYASGKQHSTSDIDVLLEIPERSSETTRDIEQEYRKKLQSYFVKNNISGVRDDLHPQWEGRRIDVYFTYDADNETRPKKLLLNNSINEELEYLFKSLSPRAKSTIREAALERIDDFEQADKIRYVEENFYDILGALEESKQVIIKCFG